MAGSLGPYIYDDEDEYSNSHFYGETREAFITDGQCRVQQAPVHEEHVVRLQDIQYMVENNNGVVTLPNLPTSDPNNYGQVWNDSGTLKISAG